MQEKQTWVRSLGWEGPLEEEILLQYSHLKKAHGQRSLEGYSPQGREESDMTEHACVSTHM